ncbi:hypothetical protein OH77DRAFT_1520720 [Trametes cingulata]|nr:hypothetical protein OH77DRAFT_1520720 [Trametes cingulata]
MSLFTANREKLVRDEWPPVLTARLAPLHMNDLAPWQLVPSDYDELSNWLTVSRTEEGAKATHPFLLLYSPDVSPIKDSRVRVTLRVLGIVESVNISPLGNYNGRKEAAPRAVQFISLTGGAWSDVFDRQRKSLDNIRSFVGTVLNCDVEDSTRKPGTIYFQRLVFTKVRRDSPVKPRSVLVFGDDPHGWSSSIRDDWVVTHKISTGVYNETGKPYKRHYSAIRPGDFVEVISTVDIIKYRKKSGWATQAKLTLQEVMRVCDKEIVQAASVTPVPQQPQSDSDNHTFMSLFQHLTSIQDDVQRETEESEQYPDLMQM